MNPESLLLNCSLNNARMIVSGESYVGGFAGGFANSTAVNCTVEAKNELTVKASGNHPADLPALQHLVGSGYRKRRYKG